MSSRSIISSPDLKAERSRNAEIGFNYHWNSALTLSGSYFHQQIKDVQAIRQAGKNYVWFNGGKLKNRGYELNAAYRWKGLTARAGVAYSRPKLNGDTADIVTTAIPDGDAHGQPVCLTNSTIRIWKSAGADVMSKMQAMHRPRVALM